MNDLKPEAFDMVPSDFPLPVCQPIGTITFRMFALKNCTFVNTN